MYGQYEKMDGLCGWNLLKGLGLLQIRNGANSIDKHYKKYNNFNGTERVFFTQ